jgi:hypothetical protein
MAKLLQKVNIVDEVRAQDAPREEGEKIRGSPE